MSKMEMMSVVMQDPVAMDLEYYRRMEEMLKRLDMAVNVVEEKIKVLEGLCESIDISKCEMCYFAMRAQEIGRLGSCNDCKLVKECEYKPNWGEHVRVNCPFWVKRRDVKVSGVGDDSGDWLAKCMNEPYVGLEDDYPVLFEEKFGTEE